MEQARHIIGGALIVLPMLALAIAVMVFAHGATNRRMSSIDSDIKDWLLDREDERLGHRPDPLRRRVKC
jgi:hypothetical protein